MHVLRNVQFVESNTLDEKPLPVKRTDVYDKKPGLWKMIKGLWSLMTKGPQTIVAMDRLVKLMHDESETKNMIIVLLYKYALGNVNLTADQKSTLDVFYEKFKNIMEAENDRYNRLFGDLQGCKGCGSSSDNCVLHDKDVQDGEA